MTEIPFFLIEAFGNKPFTGNPAAVCLLAEKLSHTVMQKIAFQFNLSETAFVHKNGDSFEIRWFTPLCEVALCGHATLAASRALWEKGEEASQITFTSKSGNLVCERTPDGIELVFPKLQAKKLEAVEEKIQTLFPGALSFSAYEKNLLVEMPDATEVISYEAKPVLFQSLPCSGIYLTAKSLEQSYDFVSRCFFPTEGIPEDPVTGSAHCTLGPFWAEKLGKAKMTAFQASARSGVLGISVEANQVRLSGKTRVFATGTILLEHFTK